MSNEAIIEQNKAKQRLWMLEASKHEEKDRDDEKLDFVPDLTDDFACPVCYEPMVPPEHKPIVLSPCGHTMCEECFNAYKSASNRSRCSVCNQEYVKWAVNYSLISMVDSIMELGNSKSDFRDEYVNTKAKLSRLVKQLKKNVADTENVKNELKSNQIVLAHLERELQTAEMKRNKIERRNSSLKEAFDASKTEIENLEEIIAPLRVELKNLLIKKQIEDISSKI